MATEYLSPARREVAKGVFQFRLNSSVTTEMESDQYISTPEFSFGGCTWIIQYYPKGIGGNGDIIVLRLQNRTATLIAAEYELGVLNKDGRPMVESWLRAEAKFDNLHCSESCMVSRSTLESNCIRDDNFVVVCTINLIYTPGVILGGCLAGVIPNRLNEELYALLKRNEDTDVVFELSGEKIAAHQLILSTRSSVFKKDLAACKTIKVVDIKPVVFKGLIHFMYTDALPDLEDLVSGKTSETSSSLFYHDLIVVADRYKVKGLQTLCEEHLCRTISVGTVLSSLSIAEENNYDKLKEECLQFILDENNYKAIALTREFYSLLSKWPSLLDDLRMKDRMI